MTVLEATAPAVTPVEQRRLMGDAYDLSGATDADSARVLAGLDWEPEHVPLYTQSKDDDGNGLGFPGYEMVEKERAVVRNDNGEMFGVVGAEHKILSNEEMFDFADTLLSAAGTSWVDSKPFGGARADGKSPFLAFQMPDGITVAGKDAVGNALLLSNGHVGNTAFTLTVTPIRYECSNVVRASIMTGKRGAALCHYTIQHSGDLAEKVKQVREALAIQSTYMAEFANLANRMAATDMALSEFDAFLAELLPVSDEAGDRAKQTVADRRAAFRQNWSTPTLTDDLRATRWGALNVITEVIDHGSTDVRRSAVPAPERRMNSVHFGTGARLRDRAFHLLAGV